MKSLELTLLYLTKGDQVVLALKKRGFGEGKWNGVGGKIEDNETVEAALERECREEIGVTPKNYIKSGYLIFNEIHNGERKLMNLHIYVATDWEGKLEESEEMKPGLFSVDSIPYDKMWDADKFWLPSVLDGKIVKGEFTLNEDNSVRNLNIEISEREVAL